MNNPAKIAVIGGSGIAGRELQGLVEHHPGLKLSAVTSGAIGRDPRPPASPVDVAVEPLDLARVAACDAAFLATPHGASAALAEALLEAGLCVVDLSADLRLGTADLYTQTYAAEHPAPELFEQAVYGLTEHARGRVRESRLVSNPGCYPTSILLPLLPLYSAGLIDATTPVLCDSKSGTSGAGAAATDTTHFGNVHENFKAYGLPTSPEASSHRHLAEIQLHANSESIGFVPHLLPVWRGILSTIYLRTDAELGSLRQCLREAYADEPFVQVFGDGLPQLSRVQNTNACHIGLGHTPGAIVIVSCIDNLQKGAAGQAVQNMNLMLGLDETAGLITGGAA